MTTMDFSWLHNHKSDQLLIVCNGWGMDQVPFIPVEGGGYDVLVLSDFRSMSIDLNLPALVKSYKKRVLLSWSMGVWVGQVIFAEFADLFQRRIAVNGTLCPIDDQYGIPRELFSATADSWSAETQVKFYWRMCRNRKVFKQFNANTPVRNIMNQRAELCHFLETVDCLEPSPAIYNEIVISEDDRIVPTSNQRAFWQKTDTRVTSLAGGHFPFYDFPSWQELLDHLLHGTDMAGGVFHP